MHSLFNLAYFLSKINKFLLIFGSFWIIHGTLNILLEYRSIKKDEEIFKRFYTLTIN